MRRGDVVGFKDDILDGNKIRVVFCGDILPGSVYCAWSGVLSGCVCVCIVYLLIICRLSVSGKKW